MGLNNPNPDSGFVSGTTGQSIPYDPNVFMAIAAFAAIAWYNVIELNVQIFVTFKRHRGLYFRSLLICSYGCVLHALGFILKFFNLSNIYVSCTIITIGWYCIVTGQSVVLYSRLHLVVRDQRTLRLVLAMIIADAICFHIPTTVLTYGSSASTNPNDPRVVRYNQSFNIFEKVQMSAFCIQEFIISGMYVWATIRLLRPVYHGRTRKVMMRLIWINLIIIALDLVLLGMEYSNQYEIEATLKPTVYSIKLKLKFAVLNQLMALANSTVNNAANVEVNNDYDKKSRKTRPAPISTSGAGTHQSTSLLLQPLVTVQSAFHSPIGFPRSTETVLSRQSTSKSFQIQTSLILPQLSIITTTIKAAGHHHLTATLLHQVPQIATEQQVSWERLRWPRLLEIQPTGQP